MKYIKTLSMQSVIAQSATVAGRKPLRWFFFAMSALFLGQAAIADSSSCNIDGITRSMKILQAQNRSYARLKPEHYLYVQSLRQNLASAKNDGTVQITPPATLKIPKMRVEGGTDIESVTRKYIDGIKKWQDGLARWSQQQHERVEDMIKKTRAGKTQQDISDIRNFYEYKIALLATEARLNMLNEFDGSSSKHFRDLEQLCQVSMRVARDKTKRAGR